MLQTVLGTRDTSLSQNRFLYQRNGSEISSESFGGMATMWKGRLSTRIFLPANSLHCLQVDQEWVGSQETNQRQSGPWHQALPGLKKDME